MKYTQALRNEIVKAIDFEGYQIRWFTIRPADRRG